MARRPLRLAGDPAADELLTNDPLALLIGMVLDQQIPLEKAFRGPADLAQRLGSRLDPVRIAATDPEGLARLFARVPAIHRYPASMAARVQELCRVIVDQYGADASKIWRDAAGAQDLLDRVRALPGFGDQKARIFVALLGKQLGVTPKGWRDVSAPFGDAGATRSVADVVDAASLARVRQFKQELKAANKEAATKAGGRTTAGAPRTAKATKATKATKAVTTKTARATTGTTKKSASRSQAPGTARASRTAGPGATTRRG